MRIKFFFSSLVVLLTANIISCSKEQNNVVRNTGVNSTGSGESAVIPAVCDQFKYPDSIFYAAELPGDYEVKPVNKLNGTFGAYPDGLDIDPFTGELEIGESETGLKYLVWFVPAGTKDTCKKFITISGVNYPDSIYSIKNNSGMATPVYNASLAQQISCSGTCEFDDGHDDDDGDGFADEPPLGQEVIPQGVSLDKGTGSINLRQSIKNGALGVSPKSGAFKDFILNYRLSDRSSKALNRTTLRIYYYKTHGEIPALLKKDLATKQGFVILNNATDPYKVPYTVKKDNSGSGKEREVKCRPPYIIVVQS